MSLTPRSIDESIRDIALAASHPTDSSNLTVDFFGHFYEIPCLVVQPCLSVLQHAIERLGQKKLRCAVRWSELSEIERGVLTKFIRQIQGQSSQVWFTSLSLTGPFWKEAVSQTSSWMSFRLRVDPREPLKALSGTACSGDIEAEHRFSFAWLGHHSFHFVHELSNGRCWSCFINPHEKSAVAFSDRGLFVRMVPPQQITLFPPADAVVVTDGREDHYDPAAISFLQMYQPALFLPEDITEPYAFLSSKNARFLMAERNSTTKLAATYFSSSCPKKGKGHSGSWIFSLPTTTSMTCFSHMVLLGTAECCSEDVFLDHCRIDKNDIPRNRACFCAYRFPADAKRLYMHDGQGCPHFGAGSFFLLPLRDMAFPYASQISEGSFCRASISSLTVSF